MIFRTLQKLSAADLIDLQRLTEPWESYNTAWTSDGTQPVVNDGVLAGRKLVTGKTVWNSIDLVMGAGTTFGTGNYFFKLSHAARAIFSVAGSIYMVDFSAGTNKQGVAALAGGTGDIVLGITSADQTVAANIPHIWAVSDKISILAQIEVA